MSLAQWIYSGALICGWAAFVGWLASEIIVQSHGWNLLLSAALTAGLVGAGLGAGLGVLMALNGFTWPRLGALVLVGFAGGLLVGMLSGLFAQLLFQMTGGRFRFLAWTFLGLGIGAITGLLDRSLPRLRNGLIGGALGGLCGGLLFEPIANLSNGMTPGALGFTILGICIGAFVGIVQVILREAWLTVMDGYQVGRQLILTQPVTILGRAEHVALPFIGASNSTLEKEHVRILRRQDGRYYLEDNHTVTGTQVNQQPVTASALLRNDDVIRLGSNLVRFNEKTKRQRDGNDPTMPLEATGMAQSNAQRSGVVATRALPPVPPLRQQGTRAPAPLPAAPGGTEPLGPPTPQGTKLPSPARQIIKPAAPPPPPKMNTKPPAPKTKPPLPPPPGGKLPPPPS